MQRTLMLLCILLAASIVGCMPQKGRAQAASINSMEQAQSLYMHRLLFRLFSLTLKQREHLVPHRLVVAQIVT